MTLRKYTLAAILCFAALSLGTGRLPSRARARWTSRRPTAGTLPERRGAHGSREQPRHPGRELQPAAQRAAPSRAGCGLRSELRLPLFEAELHKPQHQHHRHRHRQCNNLLAVEGTEETLFALNQEFDNYSFAWFDPLTWGASWEASAFFQRAETWSRNALVPVDLLAGAVRSDHELPYQFGRDANRTQIVIAQNDYDISKSDYRDQVRGIPAAGRGRLLGAGLREAGPGGEE